MMTGRAVFFCGCQGVTALQPGGGIAPSGCRAVVLYGSCNCNRFHATNPTCLLGFPFSKIPFFGDDPALGLELILQPKINY